MCPGRCASRRLSRSPWRSASMFPSRWRRSSARTSPDRSAPRLRGRCQSRSVNVPKQVEKEQCKDIPRQECTKVERKVPEQECEKVPKVSCENVPRDVCQKIIQCPVCPEYAAPAPAYEAPTYSAPEPAYEAPAAPSYSAPQDPAYEAPAAPAYE